MSSKKHVVVLTGAGISAESGLKTFRDSVDGLWNGYNIEDVCTPRAWRKDPALVLEFYNMRRAEAAKAQPNAAHYGLVELERDFDVTIITQNIDDLHERAGSSNVIHLHGEIFKMCSERNKSILQEIKGDMQLGELAEDGGQWRPFVVWFEEEVPMMETAALIAHKADVFVVIGTSLNVYPAAGLLHYAPSYCPKFIIDKYIPNTSGIINIMAIEKPATLGIKDLQEELGKPPYVPPKGGI